LIIDNWRLLLSADENKNEIVLRGLRSLSMLRKSASRLGIIIVHHTRRQLQGEHQPRLRNDPSSWIEAASGHYAFVAHLDACFGLERKKNSDGDELIILAGVARNAKPRTLLLEEDEQDLRFRVADGSGVEKIFTGKEVELWRAIESLEAFTFTDVINKTQTTNRKAAAAMLRKADHMGVITKGLDRIYRKVKR
jgi:hypothetical protein